MDVISLCPFVVSKVVWQANSGVFALTVIVKATFVLQPGKAQLAPKQDPICEGDRYHDDDPQRSVRLPSDIVPYKPRADVVLVGHAYAPQKQPVRNLVTRFVVGEMDKSIEVFCDRAFRVQDGQLLEGNRFTKMPLVWERASSGPASANPIGKRFDSRPDAYGMIAIANLQPPGHVVAKRADSFAPTCYAPVAPVWPGRTQYLGRSSRKISEGAWNAQPLPADLDPTFFLMAPPDQHVPKIHSNERIILENLHPDHPHLLTSLPGLPPRAIANRATGEREEIALVGDTLLVDTDRGICSVVWRGRIGLRHLQEAGRITVWVDGMPLVEPSNTPRPMGKVAGDDDDAAMTTIGLQARTNAPVLPFVAGFSSLAQSEISGARFSTEQEQDDGSGTMLVSVDKLGIKPIPFDKQGTIESAPEQTVRFQMTLSQDSTPSLAMPNSSRPLMLSDMPSTLGQPGSSEYQAPDPTGAFYERLPLESNGASNTHTEPPKVAVPPPPMIGPLAKGELKEIETHQAVENQQAIPAPPTGSFTENEPISSAELTLEQLSVVLAELAEGRSSRAEILREHGVNDHSLCINQKKWSEELKRESKRGITRLQTTSDDAYVTRVEEFRGPVKLDEYARLIVAIERGEADQALDELRIQRPALMRVVRLWTQKVNRDVHLSEKTAEVLASLRAQ